MRRMTGATVAALTAAALVVPAAPVFAAAEEVVVEATVTGFDPARLEVGTGATITWLNADAFEYPVARGTHRVREASGAFESPEITPGGRWSFRVLEPGTYAYVCTIHPLLMKGEIVATGAPVVPEPTVAEVQILEAPRSADWGFRPADLAIDAGTTVVWRNNGSQEHTVTGDGFDRALAPGARWERTFSKPGVYEYFCKPHPWMKAVVRVAAAGEPPPPPPPAAPARTQPRSTRSFSVPPPPPAGAAPRTLSVGAVEPDATDPSTWTFQPATLQVRAGDTVEWTNAGDAVHTVTAADGSFDLTLEPGATVRRTFRETGAIAYACTPHPWMTATLTVVAAGSPATNAVPEPAAEAPPPRDEAPSVAAPRPAVPLPPPVDRAPLAYATILGLLVSGWGVLFPEALAGRRRRRAALHA